MSHICFSTHFHISSFDADFFPCSDSVCLNWYVSLFVNNIIILYYPIDHFCCF